MIRSTLILFCFAILSSCGNSKTGAEKDTPATDVNQAYTPVQLNEKIMDLENSLAEPMLKAEAEIKARGDNGNIEGVIQSAKAMEDTIQLRLTKLKGLSTVGVGGEDFKTATVRYFEYLKSIYTTYKEIAQAKDDNAKTEKRKQMETILSSQQAVMVNLQQTQQKYAADNGFVY